MQIEFHSSSYFFVGFPRRMADTR